MKNKKGQGGLQWFIDYGWAILVVLITIGALVYYGFLPEKCVLDQSDMVSPDAFRCVDVYATPSSISISIKNNLNFNSDEVRLTIQVEGIESCEVRGVKVIPKTIQTITLPCNFKEGVVKSDFRLRTFAVGEGYVSGGDIDGVLVEPIDRERKGTQPTIQEQCLSWEDERYVVIEKVYFDNLTEAKQWADTLPKNWDLHSCRYTLTYQNEYACNLVKKEVQKTCTHKSSDIQEIKKCECVEYNYGKCEEFDDVDTLGKICIYNCEGVDCRTATWETAFCSFSNCNANWNETR